MPNLSEISTGTKLLLGAGILLLIDSFLPWQEVDVLGVSVASRNAWHGWGIFMIIALIALLAWVVIQVMNVKLNFDLPITESWLTLGLGIAVLVFAVLKVITDDFRGWAAWVGLALAALVAVGAWLRAQELGGVSFERTGEGVGSTAGAGTSADDAMGTDTMDTTRAPQTGTMGTSDPATMPPPAATDPEPPPRPPSSSSTDG